MYGSVSSKIQKNLLNFPKTLDSLIQTRFTSAVGNVPSTLKDTKEIFKPFSHPFLTPAVKQILWVLWLTLLLINFTQSCTWMSYSCSKGAGGAHSHTRRPHSFLLPVPKLRTGGHWKHQSQQRNCSAIGGAGSYTYRGKRTGRSVKNTTKRQNYKHLKCKTLLSNSSWKHAGEILLIAL